MNETLYIISLILCGVFGLLMSRALGSAALLKSVTPLTVEYEEYATAKSIDVRWFDMSLIGPCDICGCDDAPIVINKVNGGGGYNIQAKCKWCAEYDNITYHLQHKGTRRVKLVRTNAR